MAVLFIGNDWAEAHHDIEIQDSEGRVLVRRRLVEGVDGLAELHGLVAGHLGEDEEPDRVLVGIETDRGPWPQALIAAGYTVYPINPRQVARYRERHSTSGGKSDPKDAHVLAEIVRLDRAHHRPAAGDSDVGEAVKIAARAHQTMIWARQRTVNQLRSTLREFYPAALATFDDLADQDALTVLAVAPTPAQGAGLTQARVEKALRRGGRRRYVAARAAEIVAGLRAEQLPARAGLVTAYAASVSALVAVITTMVEQTQALQEQVAAGFGRHPDAEIYLSPARARADPCAAGACRVRRRPPPLRRRPGPQELRRHRPHHQGLREEDRGRRPLRAQQAPCRRPASTGSLLAERLTGSPRLLRPAPRRRNQPPQSSPSPQQPPRRHPPRLPETPHHL